MTPGWDRLARATVGRTALILFSPVAAIACVVFVNPVGVVLAFVYGGMGAYLVFWRPTNSLG